MVILVPGEYQVKEVERGTVVVYRDRVRPFADWVAEIDMDPDEADEMDELLVEYRVINKKKMTWGTFGQLAHVVVLAQPCLKGRLPWSDSICKGGKQRSLLIGRIPCHDGSPLSMHRS